MWHIDVMRRVLFALALAVASLHALPASADDIDLRIDARAEPGKSPKFTLLVNKDVATASIAYPQDFYRKLKRAAEIEGFKFIHLHTPCPPGWRFDPAKTVEVARLAVETGAWILWEYDNGHFKLNPPSTLYADKSKRKPLREYLKLQGRFAHLTDDDIKTLEAEVEEKWRFLLSLVHKS